jgi:hypothetical protein
LHEGSSFELGRGIPELTPAWACARFARVISAINFELATKKVEDPEADSRAAITLDGKYLPTISDVESPEGIARKGKNFLTFALVSSVRWLH